MSFLQNFRTSPADTTHSQASGRSILHIANRIGLSALASTGLLLPMMAFGQAQNDLQDLSLQYDAADDRSADLPFVTQMFVTAARLIEDFIAPAMGLGFLVTGAYMFASRGDGMSAIRYGIMGLVCLGLPFIIDMFMTFMAL